MKREEFRTVYDSGFEATSFALVEGLSHSIDALTARVQQLEDRLAKNSTNSSKPPSSDGGSSNPPKPKSLRTKSGKSPGGQKGHPGTTLSLVEHPDRVVLHDPHECHGCGEGLDEVEPSGYERRQLIDVPPSLALSVTEHRARTKKKCIGCGRINTAPFPEEASGGVGGVGVGGVGVGGVRGARYGPRVKALCVYLMGYYQLLPYERTRELLSDLFGAPAPGVGTLHSALDTGASSRGWRPWRRGSRRA